MFGPSILVAPFYEKQHSKRSVTLPPGNWYNFYTGKLAGNGKTIQVTADGRIPLFVKEGALVPMLAENITQTREAYGAPLEVRHYGKSAGSFDLYEDDGKTFNYQKGVYRIRTLSVSKKADGFQGAEKVSGDKEIMMFGPVVKWSFMTQ